jgi:uncharacterized membrane protein
MQPDTSLRKAFVALIITNGLIGLADAGVAFLLIFRHIVLTALAYIGSLFPFLSAVTQWLATTLASLAGHSYGVAIFYFVSHAMIKIFLCWALLKQKLWAYPLAITFFGLFSVYQLIAVIRTHAFFDGLLLLFNVIVLWMVMREYKRVRTILKA